MLRLALSPAMFRLPAMLARLCRRQGHCGAQESAGPEAHGRINHEITIKDTGNPQETNINCFINHQA
jgi:hypothetical protein